MNDFYGYSYNLIVSILEITFPWFKCLGHHQFCSLCCLQWGIWRQWGQLQCPEWSPHSRYPAVKSKTCCIISCILGILRNHWNLPEPPPSRKTCPPGPARGTPPRRRWRRWRRWWARPARRSSPAASGWSPACHASRVTMSKCSKQQQSQSPHCHGYHTLHTRKSPLCHVLTDSSLECSGSTTSSGELNINDKTNNMTHRSLRLRGYIFITNCHWSLSIALDNF